MLAWLAADEHWRGTAAPALALVVDACCVQILTTQLRRGCQSRRAPTVVIQRQLEAAVLEFSTKFDFC